MEKVKKYKHIFFDLDHTLWDFEKNSKETLFELYDKFDLQAVGGFSKERFYNKYKEVNAAMWNQYNVGEIDQKVIRTERFNRVFRRLGMDPSVIEEDIDTMYVYECPKKPHIMPYTIEVLEYLRGKYELHIVTNGFDDVQSIKMEESGLGKYFNHVFTSQTTGHKKPHPGIFDYAFKKTNAAKDVSIMIGDNLSTDIEGARVAGIDQIFYNPEIIKHRATPTYEISCLSELKSLF